MHILAVESLLIVSFGVFIFLLNKIIKPIEQISSGVNVLKDQDFSGRIRFSGVKEVDELVDVYNKMIENIKSERVFQKEQHFFLKNLIESLPVGLMILDFENQLKDYNSAAQKLGSLSTESLGKKFEELNFSNAKEILEQPLGHSFLYKTGPVDYLRIYVDQFRYKGFNQKFIVLEVAGQEILKLQKAAYAKVIRMMAHEVKNSVGAVNSILESLSKIEALPKDEQSEYLNIAIDRNANLNVFVENFAKVVRLSSPIKTRYDFSESVESIYYLMKLKFQNRNVDFVLELPTEKVFIKACQEQLEQVLINVILNAFEAISDSGEIRIKLTQNHLFIVDSGEGIKNPEKIFTPFYSTKISGQGIGLTLIREILSAHEFAFDLKTKNGKTTFEVQFF